MHLARSCAESFPNHRVLLESWNVKSAFVVWSRGGGVTYLLTYGGVGVKIAAPAAGPRHLPRVRTPPHPPGAVHRRAAGRRRAAHAARTAHRRTAGASAALRAVRRLLPVPGWRGTAGRPRVSAHGRRACRKAGAKRGPRRDGDTRLIESRIVLELQSARGIRSAYGSIGT